MLFFLVVKKTVAIALEIRVGDLLLELLAHTLDVVALTNTAGTIAALGFKSFLYGLDDLLVFV